MDLKRIPEDPRMGDCSHLGWEVWKNGGTLTVKCDATDMILELK